MKNPGPNSDSPSGQPLNPGSSPAEAGGDGTFGGNGGGGLEPGTNPSGGNAEGWLWGIAVYVVWAFFPLYFVWLQPAGALEVIVHRAFWGLLVCLAALAAMRELSSLRELARNHQATLRLMLAGALIVVNWTTYVFATMNGHIVDAALGYFTNPLITVALGIFFLGERPNRVQLAALSLGAVAVLYLIFALGHFPWISVTLAMSFGLYSLVKKSVANLVKPLAGMVFETATTAPFLLGYLGWLVWQGHSSFQVIAGAPKQYLPWWAHLLLLIGAGVITVVPLLMFAKASQTLPLYAMGLLQYISPVGQFAIGVWMFHEDMPVERWIATGIVVLALVVLSLDSLRHLRRRRH